MMACLREPLLAPAAPSFMRGAVFSRDPSWARRSGLFFALMELGFEVRIGSRPETMRAMAAGCRAVFLRMADEWESDWCPHPWATHGDDTPCFRVHPGTTPHAQPGPPAMLDEPVSVVALARLFAARSDILVPDAERQVLHLTLHGLGKREGGRDLMKELARLNAADLVELARAGITRQWTTVARLAHRFKGTGGVFGCVAVRVLAERMQFAAEQGDAGTVRLLLPVLRAALHRFTSPLPPSLLVQGN